MFERVVEMETIQKIALQQIDVADETFSVNFLADLGRLRSSIQELGLIQPVFLRKKQDGYQIICGFRRIFVFLELEISEIEARVFEDKGTEDFRLFSISLHENLTTRGFNTVEKAIALEKLIHHFQIDPIIVVKTFLPLFSLEPNEKILNTYLSLAQMEDKLKRYILKEKVSRFNIRIFSAFTPEDRMALLSLISPLKLGENHLREMLTLLEEISRRDRCGVREIVGRPEIEAILSQMELTPSQRTEQVRRVLMDFRYPEMRQCEEKFEKKRKDLNLPSHVSIHHPPFFEGTGLRVEFQFETVEEYRSVLSSLFQLMDKKEFQEMIRKG
jgi:ParB/RepB/Spo0J family partition protein